jgi:N6-adenosine-specific RNA methylase IME4
MHSTEHHRKLNSPEAAKDLGISVSTLSKRGVDGDRPVRAKTEDFCGRSASALSQRREDLNSAQRREPMTAPDLSAITGKFRVILVDPPWRFITWSRKGRGRSADAHYNTMTIAELEAMAVEFDRLAAKDCALLLWVTDPIVVTGKAQRLIEAWGFIPKTVEFYWAKATKDGTGFPVGNGYHTRANPEQCWVAVRGHPKRQDKGVPRLITAPRERHSAKPDIVHDRIERLYPGPYLELFARQSRPGWTNWGNQLDSGPTARRWASNSYRQEEAAE